MVKDTNATVNDLMVSANQMNEANQNAIGYRNPIGFRQRVIHMM